MCTRLSITLVMVLSLITAGPASAELPVATTPPALTAPERVFPGTVLTATPAVWTGAPTSIAVEWRTCVRDQLVETCPVIPGATSRTYTAQPSDIGFYLIVDEVATNESGQRTEFARTLSGRVEPTPLPPRPVNTVPPIVTGKAFAGETLTANPGAWTGAPPITFTHQWSLCKIAGCVDIPGATAPTLTLTEAHVGGLAQVKVTATNAGGSQIAWAYLSRPIASGLTTVLGQTLVPQRAIASIRALLKRRPFNVEFAAPGPGRFKISFSVPIRGKSVVIARTSRSIPYEADVITGLEISPQVARLRRARRVTMTATASFTPTGGRTTTVTRKLKLRR